MQQLSWRKLYIGIGFKILQKIPTFERIKIVIMNQVMRSIRFLIIVSVLILSQTGFAQEKVTKVAIIGNSITEGTFLKNPSENSYPGQLAKMLPAGWEVGNFGVSGRTMLKKGDFPIWKEQKFKNALNFQPNMVVIMLGTNDSKPYNWVHGDDFYADYISMIDTFENLPSHPKVIVCYPPKAFTHAYNINDSVIHDEIIPIIQNGCKRKKFTNYRLLHSRKR